MTRGVIGNTSGFGPEESQVRALDESTKEMADMQKYTCPTNNGGFT